MNTVQISAPGGSDDAERYRQLKEAYDQLAREFEELFREYQQLADENNELRRQTTGFPYF